MAAWYLFDLTIREVGSINITLEHLLLEAIGKIFGKKKTQFNCFDQSCIWDFGNT